MLAKKINARDLREHLNEVADETCAGGLYEVQFRGQTKMLLVPPEMAELVERELRMRRARGATRRLLEWQQSLPEPETKIDAMEGLRGDY